MKRRELLKKAGLATGGLILGNRAMAAGKTTGGLILGDRAIAPSGENPQKVLRVLHITDVHLKAGLDAPARFARCLEHIRASVKDIDFILNGGDSLDGTDPLYGSGRTIEFVETAWERWVTATQAIRDLEMYACIGNHDVWYKEAAIVPTDEPWGGEALYVAKFKMPGRYYSFDKKNWHFIVLDSFFGGGNLDGQQRTWLENDLKTLKANTPIVVMSHYPILGAATQVDSGNHGDSGYIVELFYQHRDKKIYCFSGHDHLLDEVEYNGVHYFNNGAMSGDWWMWGPGQSSKQETPPGYAVLDLYEDGTLVNEYIPHPY